MTEYQYKCVKGPATLHVKAMNEASQVVGTYADLINKEACDGWEFYAIEPVIVKIEAGVSWEAPVPIECKMLVFRKPKKS